MNDEDEMPKTVGEVSALRVEFSRAYHLTYDQVESVTKETYADYCHVLIQLDYMYNIPNIVRFVPEDTSKMDIKSFYSCLEKYGVALAVSPKTKERCIELGEKYGDQGLIDYVKFGHERVCSSQTVIDLNVDSNKPS